MIIDHNEFDMRVGLFADGLQTGVEKLGAVLGGHDDGYEGVWHRVYILADEAEKAVWAF